MDNCETELQVLFNIAKDYFKIPVICKIPLVANPYVFPIRLARSQMGHIAFTHCTCGKCVDALLDFEEQNKLITA